MKMLAANFGKKSLNINFLGPVYDAKLKPVLPGDGIPYIVRKTPKFDDVNPVLQCLRVHYTNIKETLLTENLFNELEFKRQPTQRVVRALRLILSKSALDVIFYIRDEPKAPLSHPWEATIVALRKEHHLGNIYQHFYTEKL